MLPQPSLLLLLLLSPLPHHFHRRPRRSRAGMALTCHCRRQGSGAGLRRLLLCCCTLVGCPLPRAKAQLGKGLHLRAPRAVPAGRRCAFLVAAGALLDGGVRGTLCARSRPRRPGSLVIHCRCRRPQLRRCLRRGVCTALTARLHFCRCSAPWSASASGSRRNSGGLREGRERRRRLAEVGEGRERVCCLRQRHLQQAPTGAQGQALYVLLAQQRQSHKH